MTIQQQQQIDSDVEMQQAASGTVPAPVDGRTYLETVEIIPGKLLKKIMRYGDDGSSDNSAQNSENDSAMQEEGQSIEEIFGGQRVVVPPSGAQVFVHYDGRLASNGAKFDSSRDRGQPFDFKLGENRVISGWEKGVATMKRGEYSEFWISYEMAYGASGSPPSIPPKADLIFDIELLDWQVEDDVTPDVDHAGSIKKTVMRPADGGYIKPGSSSRVKINYRLFQLNSNNTNRVVKQLDAAQNFEYTLEEEQMWSGLDACLQTMLQGEHSRFQILDHFDKYGLAEMPSFAEKYGVPADSPLLVDIELLSFQNETNKWDLSIEQKFAMCEQKRKEGNEFFEKKRFTMALKRYQKALDYVDNEKDFEQEEHKKRVRELQVLCHSNLAAVHHTTQSTELRDLEAVVHHTTQALQIDPFNIKCLYRRACALREQKDFEGAQQDLKVALEKDPNNKALQLEMKKVKDELRAQNEKDKKIYAKMFA